MAEQHKTEENQDWNYCTAEDSTRTQIQSSVQKETKYGEQGR